MNKEVIEKILNAYAEIDKIKRSIKDDVEKIKDTVTLDEVSVDKQVKQRVYDYSVLEYGDRIDPSGPEHIDEWSISGGYVTAAFSETWAYGGYADGFLDMPTQYLDDDEWNRYSELKAKEKEVLDNKKKEEERKDKERQLEALKKELGVA